MNNDTTLAKLDKARVALMEARTLQDVKTIIDMAKAAEVYAKEQGMAEESIKYAQDIKLEAQRRLGQILKENPKNEGKLKKGTVVVSDDHGKIPTLKELNISKDLSSQSQKLASMSDDLFEDVKESKISIRDAVKIDKLDKSQQKQIISKIKSGEVKSVKEAVVKVKQEDRSKESKNIKLTNVFNGDSVAILKTLKDNSVDCVVTDPPYGIEYKDTRETHNKKYKDGTEYALNLLNETCKELKRVCKKDAHLYFFSGYSNMFAFKEILSKYFKVQENPIIWAKNNHTMCDFSKQYASKYEVIWFCKNGEGRSLNYKCSEDILEYAIPQKKEHSAQKPIDLLKYLISNSTVKGEVVLDPFAGSGSTGIASKDTDRNYILIELEKEYYELILSRIK